MPRHIEDGFSEYAKRMPPELAIELKEIKSEALGGSLPVATALRIERERIEAHIPRGAYQVVLDERGRDLNTQQLSHCLRDWMQNGQDIAFIIGSANGLDPELKQRAALQIRLSSMTFPHGLVRVMLAEQLYRAWTLLTNHPYHRI